MVVVTTAPDVSVLAMPAPGAARARRRRCGPCASGDRAVTVAVGPARLDLAAHHPPQAGRRRGGAGRMRGGAGPSGAYRARGRGRSSPSVLSRFGRADPQRSRSAAGLLRHGRRLPALRWRPEEIVRHRHHHHRFDVPDPPMGRAPSWRPRAAARSPVRSAPRPITATATGAGPCPRSRPELDALIEAGRRLRVLHGRDLSAVDRAARAASPSVRIQFGIQTPHRPVVARAARPSGARPAASPSRPGIESVSARGAAGAGQALSVWTPPRCRSA